MCTPGADGTEKLYEVAEQLVHTAVVSPDRPRVACRCVVLPNAYDIAQIKPVIERIYETLPLGLHEDDVIADFTGGTGAMTAGVVLATLSRRRKTQYLLQQKPLLEEQDGKLRYLTPQDIRDKEMLVMIKAIPELVSQQTEDFAARR